MKNKLLLFLVVAPLFGLLMAGAQFYYLLNIWSYTGENVVFEVNPGEGFSSINSRLHNNGIISNPRVFHRYAQWKGYMTKFRSGSFEIKRDSTTLQIIESLIYGKPVTIGVTIPEGKNMYEVAKILEQKKITSASEFLSFAKDKDFLNNLGIRSKTVEGYLYPETYQLGPNSKPDQVLKTMVGQFKRNIKDLDFEKTNLSPFEVLTLASIVEKETGAPWERPTIAGVFMNRLQKKMRLQSDPTIIYGIYERYTGNLRKKDIEEVTEYNTYRIPALPSGPICNPGREAISAVLNPEKHDYLFFVSNNDGTHIFSKNYRDHLKGVETYQKDRRNREGKSWRNLSQKLEKAANH